MSKLRLVGPDGVPPGEGPPRDGHWAAGITSKPIVEQHFLIKTYVGGAEIDDRLESALRAAWEAMIDSLCRQDIAPTPEHVLHHLQEKLARVARNGFAPDKCVAYLLDSLRDHGVPRTTVLAATGWTPGAYKERMGRGQGRRPPRRPARRPRR